MSEDKPAGQPGPDEGLLARLLDSMAEAVAAFDADGRLLFANRHARELLGCAPGAAGAALADVRLPGGRDTVERNFDAATHGGHPAHGGGWMGREDGGSTFLTYTFTPMWACGEPCGAVLVARDAAGHVGRHRPLPEPLPGAAEPLVADEPAEPLTQRERQVARLLAAGLHNRDIAAALFVAESTVKTHVDHIMAKLGAADRVQVAVWAARQGLAESGR